MRNSSTAPAQLNHAGEPGHRVLLLAFLVCALPAALSAQTNPGLLAGSVVEGELGYPVEKALVRVAETGQSATTDNEGRFRIASISAGIYSLTISRDGFVTSRKEGVVVRAAEVTRTNLELTAKVIEFDTIVIQPLTEEVDQTVAIDIDTSLGKIGEVLDADFLSKRGTSDAGDAIKNVAGASVADSRYVVIRGLSDRYNVVVLNGARIPSSDPDRRAVNIDIFPGNLIENLVVQKTFTPDIPGESTGGYVNIVTTGIPKENFAKFSYGIKYNHLATGHDKFVLNRNGGGRFGTGMLGTSRKRKIPDALRAIPTDGIVINRTGNATGFKASELFSAGSTTRGRAPVNFSFSASAGAKGEFFGKPAGIIGAVSYSKKYGYGPNEFTQKAKYTGRRGRLISDQRIIEEGTEEVLAGALLSVGWQPREDDLVKLTYFGNVAAEDSAFYSIGLGRPTIESENGINPNNDIFARLDAAARGQSVDVLEAEESRYVERQLHTWQASGIHHFDEDELNWALAYSRSFQDEPEIRLTNVEKTIPQGSYNFIDRDFPGFPVDRIWRRIDDSNYFARLDHTMQLIGRKDEAGSARLRFGGSFDHSRRRYRADNFQITANQAANRLFTRAPLNDPDDAGNFTFADQLISFLDDPSQLRGFERVERVSAPDVYSASQSIFGGFFSTTINYTDSFTANFGLRVEEYRQFVDSELAVLPVSFPNSVRNLIATAPDPFVQAQTDFMPQLSGRWEATEGFSVSGAFSRTVARPSFKEIAPVATRVIGEPGKFFVGNPRLEVSTISNYDVRLEWAPPGSSNLFALSGFTKQIDKPIEFVSGSELELFRNADSGVVWGWELEASKKLDDFHLLRDMTISGNFARIFSGVVLPRDDELSARLANGLSQDRRLQGQPDYLMNFGLSYDDEDHGLFVGLFLNITGEILVAGGSGSASDYALDVLQQPRTTLDLAVSKQLSDHWKVSLRGENLLDSSVERLYSDGLLRSISHAGRSYSVSVSGSW